MEAGANSLEKTRNCHVKYKPVRVFPGRIRVNIEELLYNGIDKVKNFLGQLAGTPAVTHVKFSSVTKTVVIHYSPNTLSPQEILSRLFDSGPTHETNKETEEYFDIILNYANNRKGGDLELLNTHRYGDLVTTWKIKRSFPGRIRLRNPFLSRNRSLAQRLDRELAKEPGITKCDVSPISGGVLKDGKEIQVAVETLKEDDIISVDTGEQIPVDGIVIDGDAMVDQHNITGESAPVERSEGEEVFASTLLVAGKAQVKALKTGQNTYASQIIDIINAAADHKVKVQSIGERLADKMVIPTFAMGALGLLTAGPNGLLAILNADYGRGIRVAAPLAMLSHLAIAAQQGLLIKDAHVLESIKDTDVVLFDKTGTLTKEVPEVSRIISANRSFEETNILLYAAAAEQRFSHPISRALLQKAEQLAMKLPPRNESQYHVGFGIEVGIHDDYVKVGSVRYIQRERIDIPERIQKELENVRARGNSAICVAVNERLAGMIEFQSSSRPEAGIVIEKLRKRGIREIVLISGDHEAPTKYLADQLCVDRYFAGVLPHEKAEYVELLQKEGKKVIMVGDGVNDSVALSCADIGISISGASTLAMDVSDVVFMDGDLGKFDYLFEIAEAFNKNVKRSFLMILIPNTLCIALAFFRLAGLPASLVLNNGFNLLSAINGMLPYIRRTSITDPLKAIDYKQEK